MAGDEPAGAGDQGRSSVSHNSASRQGHAALCARMVIDEGVLPHLGDHGGPSGGLPLRGMGETAAVEAPIAIEALVRNDSRWQPVGLLHQTEKIEFADRLRSDMPQPRQRRMVGQ